MSISSPALALADTTAQAFTFPRRGVVKIQIRFYTDVDATAGSEIAASGGGSRTVTISTITPSIVLPLPDLTTVGMNVESAIEDGSQVCNGATWTLFGLGDGFQQLNVSASGGADPGAANSYRIWLDVEPNG